MCDYRKPKEDLSKQMSDDANTSLHLTSVQMKLVNHKHFDFQTKFPNKFQTRLYVFVKGSHRNKKNISYQKCISFKKW